jgi:UTP--glucose-1-phosphate uridylyltransferase
LTAGRPRVRKAVIPAAGLGSRFLPATKAVPKEMLPIVDRPIIQYIVEEAVASGIEHITIITAQGKRAIEDHFDAQFEIETRLAQDNRKEDLASVRAPTELAEFTFVRQGGPKGNGHAVLCARAAVGNESFAMIWGDDIVHAEVPCIAQLIEVYERYGGSVAAVMQVPDDQISSYGIIDGERVGDRVYRLRGIVEKPPRDQAPSNLAAVHAWILTPRIFEILAHTSPGKGGEIWLVDAIAELMHEEPVYAYEFEGRRYDVGSKLGLIEASIDFALRRPDLAPSLRAYMEAALWRR